ncbi:MAG: zinc-binding dehydrogenase [Proteobacteria bacterium]|nr:zinc-binding dehydrogenase [Pseudomonadota bacterium]
MKAVITNPKATGCLELGEVADPRADSHEAVIAVTAFSLNRGELRRAEAAAPGTQIGWDLVGLVKTAARDGSGPAQGARVVGFSRRMQGWAQYVALPTVDFAVIPDAVSECDAATLPVAGLTALYALERCERLLGSRVLVTGASGGVGYFACQLGRLMGAQVTAQLRRPDFEDLVRATGVDDVVISPDGAGLESHGKFRAIIDGVGGQVLSRLLSRLDERGRAILYGVSGGPETALAVRELMFTGDGRIEGFYLYRETEIEAAAKGLGRLLHLLADGRLTTHVPVTENWATIGATAARLIGRDFAGKAVLTI